MSKLGALFRPKQDVDMSEGNILRHLINYSFPLMLGNVFQILYHTVDTWVLGNYVGGNAYSAVGSVGSITTLLVGLFMGLSSGAGVVISQHYGAKQEDKVQEAVHTSILMTLLLGVLFTFVGIAITPVMLNLMNMPPEAMGDATTYLTIYFAGITGLMLYNIGAGILRAVGDSQRPFYFLVVCAVLNTILDLLFVIFLKGYIPGVAGVALATALSQFISAILVLITLMRNTNCIRLSLRKLKIHWTVLKKILTVGIPAALQMAITSFSNIFVQSYINHFGTACMGGWTSYSKIDSVVMIPMSSISLASTTFVGQNLGKNQVERARKGVTTALLLAITTTILISIPIIIFAPSLAYFFNDEPAINYHAELMLRWMTPFYFLSSFTNIYTGALRGSGNSKAPMIITLASYVAFRQIYLFIMSRVCNKVLPIIMGYPAGWLLCAILLTIYYHKVNLGKTRLVEDN
ncbi:MAG: MATE family efflux transporter [Ruminococcaceae bacterium]|nr:MATE family efflux transporter [Oscillospiraceae bacterium]